MDHEAWRRNVQGGLPRLLAAWGSLVVLSYILWSTHSRNVAVDDFRLWMAKQRAAANPTIATRKEIQMSTVYSATGTFDSNGVSISITVQVVQREGETGTEAVERLHQKRAAAEAEHGDIQWQ